MRNPKKGGAKPTPKAAASKSGSGSKAKKVSAAGVLLWHSDCAVTKPFDTDKR
jgi:hypothetical protein